MFTYEYIGEQPRTFPTLGIEVKKGDKIKSEIEITSPFVSLVSKKDLGSENNNTDIQNVPEENHKEEGAEQQ